MKELSLRELNRTLLLRQHLTTRVSMPALDLIRHLIAVQGQEPNWPYVGLWTRLTDFRHEDLTTLLEDRTVVRATTIRRTVHLSTADDYRWLYPTVRPDPDAALRAIYFRETLSGLDLGEFATAGKELLTGRTVPRRDLGRALTERFPHRDPGRLVHILGHLHPLIHDTDSARWNNWGSYSVAVTLADEWTNAPLASAPQSETMVLRYLAAFGPATIADIQAWAGVTRLTEVVTRLRPRLRVFQDESGRELFDVPDAPLAAADTPAPVRFLPAFDNALLAHRDRRRMISDEDRARINKIASGGVPMYLVDGFVHGRWDLDGSTIRVTPWHPLTRTDEAAILEEAANLLPYITPDTDGKVIIDRR
ncbi:winged helix DNA-binding domain-containing protein [Nocardia sp. NPDC088792]|uniref:winged helix DNA-binding domain-containing protein n=1 Tax=Nocardia sp. NPDC088792 TaxID=3364332 RepID=UPI003827CE18